MVWFASKSYIAHLVCLIVYYYYYKMPCKRKMSCSMSSKREMSKPKAANWRNTPLPNYERMMILYGNDRATREEPETASEIRKRRHSATEEEFTTTIDKLFSQNEVTLENADAFIDIDNDNVSNLSAQHPSPGGNIGTNKKKKKEVTTKEKDNEFEVIKGAISEVAAALREGNAILRDICNYKLPPISGEETWNLIKECGCDVNLLPKIYCFLMSDVGKLRTVLQCPAEARKAVIMQMVFGFSYSPS